MLEKGTVPNEEIERVAREVHTEMVSPYSIIGKSSTNMLFEMTVSERRSWPNTRPFGAALAVRWNIL